MGFNFQVYDSSDKSRKAAALREKISKYSEKPVLSRGNTTSIHDLGTTDNFIIVPGDANYRQKENLRVCGIEPFVEEYLPQF